MAIRFLVSDAVVCDLNNVYHSVIPKQHPTDGRGEVFPQVLFFAIDEG